MSKTRFLGAVALSLALASASVQAATMVASVGDFQGKVLVNQGNGFVPVAGRLALKAGDTVMVGEESFATVTYNNECSVALTSPTMFIVSGKAPCAKGERVASVDGAFIAPAYGPPPSLLPLLLVGGAGLTVGIIVLATHKKHAVSAP